MKKLLISLVLLCLFLISRDAFAISEQEAKRYLNKNVFVVIVHTTSVGLYGRIIDIVEINGEVYIVLDTNYRGRKLMFLQAKNITYIRERKSYE